MNEGKRVRTDTELLHVRMKETEEHLMRKLGRIFHGAEDSGRCLTSQEVDDVKDIWEVMKYLCAVDTLVEVK